MKKIINNCPDCHCYQGQETCGCCGEKLEYQELTDVQYIQYFLLEWRKGKMELTVDIADKIEHLLAKMVDIADKIEHLLAKI